VQQTLLETSLATGPAIDWPTYGGSIRRTGENANETILTPSTLSSLSQKWTYTLDSVVTTPPVEAAGVSTAAGPQDLVFVGDEHGNFVALNEHTGAVAWQRNLGSATTTCTLTSLDNIVGITAAAAIDRATNRIYEVGGSGLLYGLDLGSGATIAGWPVALTASPDRETDWGALTLNAGSIYAVLGGTCDKAVYHGRVIQVDTTSPAILKTFYVTPSGGQSGGAIWGWGGSAVDVASGAVYVGTGNSLFAPEDSFYSEAVVKLDSALSLIAYDQPVFPCCKTDLDFGSAPVLFQATGCPAQLAIQNKDGELMVYNRDSIASGPVQRIVVPVDSNFKHGMLVFTESSPSCTLTTSWNTRNGVGGTTNSPPTVAGNVVYESNGRSGVVYAYDALTGAVLWNSGTACGGPVWSSPTVVNGMLFVVSWDHKIHAFGI
jgi:outer membrane protein assembly factor BamB